MSLVYFVDTNSVSNHIQSVYVFKLLKLPFRASEGGGVTICSRIPMIFKPRKKWRTGLKQYVEIFPYCVNRK